MTIIIIREPITYGRKIESDLGAGSQQMKRRQFFLVFVDEVKQVGFSASFKGGAGR